MVAVDYNAVVSLSPEEFESRALACAVERLADRNRFTKSDEEDLARTERLLDLQPGTLTRQGVDYFLEYYQCECGRVLTTYDFAFTGLIDAGHSKSLILHTFVGNKLLVNQPRKVRCSQCSRISAVAETY